MEVIRLFTGWDARESAGLVAFSQSVRERASLPVAATSVGAGLVSGRSGTNSFTYSRFLVPWLCDFRGFAIFADGVDMLARADLAELWETRSMGRCAVRVVRREDYATRHPRKYAGTEMEADNADYPRKNWSSLVVWDCSHYMNRQLTPEYVAAASAADLHRFGWLPDDRIGDLPPEWNVLVGEEDCADAKMAHFTLGIPGFKEYAGCAYADEWRAALGRALAGLQTHCLEET